MNDDESDVERLGRLLESLPPQSWLQFVRIAYQAGAILDDEGVKIDEEHAPLLIELLQRERLVQFNPTGRPS